MPGLQTKGFALLFKKALRKISDEEVRAAEEDLWAAQQEQDLDALLDACHQYYSEVWGRHLVLGTPAACRLDPELADRAFALGEYLEQTYCPDPEVFLEEAETLLALEANVDVA